VCYRLVSPPLISVTVVPIMNPCAVSLLCSGSPLFFVRVFCYSNRFFMPIGSDCLKTRPSRAADTFHRQARSHLSSCRSGRVAVSMRPRSHNLLRTGRLAVSRLRAAYLTQDHSRQRGDMAMILGGRRFTLPPHFAAFHRVRPMPLGCVRGERALKRLVNVHGPGSLGAWLI